MAEANIFIKFDPVKISEVANDLEHQHKRLIQSVTNIRKKSESLTSNWLGDSSKLYMDRVQDLYARSEKMAKVLLTFSQDLASASGIYKTGETQAKQKAEALPTDGVFLV